MITKFTIAPDHVGELAYTDDYVEDLKRKLVATPSVRSEAITDEEILALWRTVRPSTNQDRAMVYLTEPYDVVHPTRELRLLVELVIKKVQSAPVGGKEDQDNDCETCTRRNCNEIYYKDGRCRPERQVGGKETR